MKIAVCFSGVTRNFEDTYPYFKKNLFDQYDTDVFIYGSPNKYGMDYNLDKLNSLYNPQKVILNDHTFYSELDKQYNFKDPLGKMWYNALGADNLRRECEIENKFEYDYVLKMRFDYFFLRTLEEVDIDLNQIDLLREEMISEQSRKEINLEKSNNNYLLINNNE